MGLWVSLSLDAGEDGQGSRHGLEPDTIPARITRRQNPLWPCRCWLELWTISTPLLSEDIFCISLVEM